jgi:hypothetical protein
MKKTVLALSILFAACSSNSDDIAPEEEGIPTNILYVTQYCPDEQNRYHYYWVTAEERKRVNDLVNSTNEYCVYIKFTTYKKEKIEGFYAGESSIDD